MSPLGDRPLSSGETCQNVFSKDDRNIKSDAAGKKLQLLHEVLKLRECRLDLHNSELSKDG